MFLPKPLSGFIEDNSNTLHLSGNGWTQISMPIQILSNTVLEFDFNSASQGEVHGIGFDTDQNSDTASTFKLYGTQAYGLTAFNDYAAFAPEWKHYVIPVGQYYSGQALYLFFANDHDVANPMAEGYFSNVQIRGSIPTPTPTPWAPTPTITFTPSSTPTITQTPTPITQTPTPTFTATSSQTSIHPTPPPNYGGAGTCWESAESWAVYTVTYAIDRNTIPVSFGWDSSLQAASQTWNNVTPSHFEFVYSADSGNVISFGVTQDQNAAAETGPTLFFNWLKIAEKWTVINSNFNWDTNNTPIPGDPNSNGSATTLNVQNVMTHEFGHWLRLLHSSCISSTMYPYTGYGRIDWITLDSSDENAINWQYP